MQKKLAIGLVCVWLTAWFTLTTMHGFSHALTSESSDTPCALCLSAESGSPLPKAPNFAQAFPATVPLAADTVVAAPALPARTSLRRPSQPRAPPAPLS